MSNTSCLNCGDGVSWHRQYTDRNSGLKMRGGCNKPTCQCPHFRDSGISTPNPQGDIIEFKPRTEASRPEIIDRVEGNPELANFMLNMAGDFLVGHRLNTLSVRAIVDTAKLGPTRCYICSGLVQSSSEVYTQIISREISFTKFVSPEHLTVTHVAEIFGIPESLLRMIARPRLEEAISQGIDEQEEEEDEAIDFYGWKSFTLDIVNNRPVLFSDYASSPWYTKDLYSECEKGYAKWVNPRELSLKHLEAPATGSTLNEANLTINVQRPSCTCGLYCYTDEVGFTSGNYRKFGRVLANVFGYGTVQMGADHVSFRSSDMLINKLTVVLNRVQIRTRAFWNPPVTEGWNHYVKGNISINAHSELCQELAIYYQVPVMLRRADSIKEDNASESIEDTELIGTFLPPEIPNWT